MGGPLRFSSGEKSHDPRKTFNRKQIWFYQSQCQSTGSHRMAEVLDLSSGTFILYLKAERLANGVDTDWILLLVRKYVRFT